MGKKRPKKSASAVKSAKSKPSLVSKAVSAVGVASGLMGSGKKSGGRRSRKKSALWYAKEIQRLKLKRRFEKVKFGVR